MAITVSCECGKRFATKNEHAGKQTKCPACKRPLTIPSPKADLDLLELDVPEEAAPSAPAAVENPAMQVALAEDEILCSNRHVVKFKPEEWATTVKCKECGQPVYIPWKANPTFVPTERPELNAEIAPRPPAGFLEWHRAKFSHIPLLLMIVIWYVYGFIWIPVWYAIDRRTPIIIQGHSRLAQKPRLAPNLGCCLAFGMFVWAVYMPLVLFEIGLLGCFLQQILVFLCAMGLVHLPLLRGIAGDFKRIENVYEEHPDYLRVPSLLIRLIPFVSYLILWRETLVMLKIVLGGVPVAFFLQLIFMYVLPLPRWGESKPWGLLDIFLCEAALTFVFTPFTVMIALGLRKVFPARVGTEHASSTGSLKRALLAAAALAVIGFFGWNTYTTRERNHERRDVDKVEADRRRKELADLAQARVEEARARAEEQLRLEGTPTQWCGKKLSERRTGPNPGRAIEKYQGCGRAVPKGSRSCPFCGADFSKFKAKP